MLTSQQRCQSPQTGSVLHSGGQEKEPQRLLSHSQRGEFLSFFETGFLHVVLAVLVNQSRLSLNSQEGNFLPEPEAQKKPVTKERM